ncbi:MAG: hypothetical protein WC364_01015 [Eubacteriales bacterium]
MLLLTVRPGGKENVNWNDGLLISILVRYPEIATINFDPVGHYLKFSFISSTVLEPEYFDRIKKQAVDSLEVFNHLEGRKTNVVEINRLDCDQLNIIEVQRDLDTLAHEEIALIVKLARMLLGENLVTENADSNLDDDQFFQEEIIEYMLESMKGSNSEKSLFAFREEDRVLVFNK